MFKFFSMLDNLFMISPFNMSFFYNFQYNPVHVFPIGLTKFIVRLSLCFISTKTFCNKEI